MEMLIRLKRLAILTFGIVVILSFASYSDNKNGTIGKCVVAVFGTGVNIDDINLRDNICYNENEMFIKPDTGCLTLLPNGIDDDRNGYIDDLYGYNVLGDNYIVYYNDAVNPNFHETLISYIIKRFSNGNCRILPIVCLKNGENVITKNVDKYIIDGIKYCKRRGVQICNLSLFLGEGCSDELLYEIKRNNSILFIFAAGNNGQNIEKVSTKLKELRTLQNVLVVGSAQLTPEYSENGEIKTTLKIEDFSNYGNGVNVYTDYGNVTEIIQNIGVVSAYGTSYSTGKVSGVCCEIFNLNNTLTPQQIKEELYKKCVLYKDKEGKFDREIYYLP